MAELPELNNTYIAMRHGRSVPNEKGIIISARSNGILPEYGLVKEGVEQARYSAEQAGLPEDTVVVTSPFSRAYQTAEVPYRVANAEDFIVDDRLGERGFGDMELESAELYKDVWARDYVYANHHYRGVESLEEVAAREMDALNDLERTFARRTIVLVGHADPLNILTARLWGIDVRHHRVDFSLKNAEMRLLARTRQS